jgi:lysozyme
MKISNNGIAFIKREEGEKLTAYQDSVGVWTIGVGHTGIVDGKPVTRGMTITQSKSTSLLISDLAWVESAINGNVKVPLTQNQYDALCSLVFNIGRNAFTGSTLLRLLNVNNYKGAADQFLQWKRTGSDPDLLLPRRKRERELFNT